MQVIYNVVKLCVKAKKKKNFLKNNCQLQLIFHIFKFGFSYVVFFSLVSDIKNLY